MTATPDRRRGRAPSRRGRPPRRGAAGAGLAAVLLALLALLPVPPAGATGTRDGEAAAGADDSDEPRTAEVATPDGDLTAAERRGKRIYLTGESPSGGEVTALMGDGGIPVPATALPCSSCHGRDGRGRPEGGVEPSDLTWEALTRPYEVTTVTGRTRGPYTPRLLTRAIGLGVDSSGNELDTVMPRYRMSRQDSGDLLAYLRKLGHDRDPGVGDAHLEIGVLLPPREVPGAAETAAAVGRVVDAYARRANADGGVYGRRLRLHFEVLPADPAARPAALERFVTDTPVFALVASYTAGADAHLADAAERLEVPLVGPLTLYPDESFPPNRQVFYLDGGLVAQAGALAAAAAQRAEAAAGGPPPVVAVLHPEDGPLAAVAAAAAGRAGGRVVRLPYPGAAFDPAAAARDAFEAGAGEVLLLAPEDAVAGFLATTARLGAGGAVWGPGVGVPGTLAGAAATAPHPGFAGRLFVAYTTLPGDRSPAGLERLSERLAGEAGGADDPLSGVGVHAFLAMDTLVQGLEETGRDLTREGLIGTLELVRQRHTGLSRPLSFSPNRRVAVRGAYVVEVDPAGGGPLAASWVPAR